VILRHKEQIVAPKEPNSPQPGDFPTSYFLTGRFLRIKLLADRIADIFDSVADFPANLPECLLGLTRRLIPLTLLDRLGIVSSPSYFLLNIAFDFFKFAFYFVFIW